jgi:hypothetical protein
VSGRETETPVRLYSGTVAKWVALLTVVLVAAVGCGGGESDSRSDSSASPSPTRFDQQLHDELMAMFRRDQAGRTGGVDDEGDTARTERLKEIIEEYGWPTIDLVGKDGADAAWTIAQHSDLDPAFQETALELIRAAAEDGQASWGNVAYLEDRVAVAKGAPQTYGTQIGCGPKGPKLATPLTDPERVDDLRAKAGLDPLDAYLAEMAAICRSEQ